MPTTGGTKLSLSSSPVRAGSAGHIVSRVRRYESANVIVAQMLFLYNENPKSDIQFYINSPGGSVSSGFGIIDTMRHLRCDVATTCIGMAASMGACLLAVGTKGKRSVLPNAQVMLHQPLIGGVLQGPATDLGIEAQHIPFRGPNEAFTEVLAGRIDFYFLPLAPALPLVQQGQLTALAVSSEKRATALPDVPTTTELGLKDSTFLFWTGVFLPAKTPRDIVNKLHEESRKALQVPAVQERIAKTGNEPMPMTVDQFEAFFKDDVRATAKLMQQIGIKPQD